MDYIAQGMSTIAKGIIFIGSFGKINPFKNDQITHHTLSIEEQQKIDAAKIAEDWRKIGDDMRQFWH